MSLECFFGTPCRYIYLSGSSWDLLESKHGGEMWQLFTTVVRYFPAPMLTITSDQRIKLSPTSQSPEHLMSVTVNKNTKHSQEYLNLNIFKMINSIHTVSSTNNKLFLRRNRISLLHIIINFSISSFRRNSLLLFA